jgi:hypothetical protein
MHAEALYSGVVIIQPKKDINNQHWIDKILEECSTRKYINRKKSKCQMLMHIV